MTSGVLGSGPRTQAPVKHRVFVSYHHGGDQAYYNKFSQAFHDTYDVIYDTSLDRRLDGDNVDYVMRGIRENYITGSSCTIVLVGAKTWGRKYVDREIKATLDAGHGLIGVHLPTATRDQSTLKFIVPGRVVVELERHHGQRRTLERYVANAKTRAIAEALREHFRRKLYKNVAGGTGLSVLFRTAAVPGLPTPLPIDLNDAQTTAVVVLADPTLSVDTAWGHWLRELVERSEGVGFGTRVFPVALEAKVLDGLGLDEQALRWDQWTGSLEERSRRLISELTYELCRMLRHYLEHLKHPGESDASLEAFLKKVQIFLSHSKHDGDGERIAKSIRDRLHASHGLSSFFDVHNIPASLRFQKVLLHQVRVSAMVF